MAGPTVATLSEKVARLEELIGIPESTDVQPLQTRCENMKADLDHIRLILENHMRESEERIVQLETSNAELYEEVTILRKAVAVGGSTSSDGARKFKVPDPKTFEGGRDAKALENFLWDMEQYFKASRIGEVEQVTVASMFLAGDAKLWWRTRMEDVDGTGKPGIQTWEAMKKELKEQFLPSNAAWMAREKLKHLKQTGSVREYVKAFTSNLLDIRDMAEADRLFNFISGLKPWAQAELRRQNVKDLTAAIVAADSLVDFATSSNSKGKQTQGAKEKGQKFKGKKKVQDEESSKAKNGGGQTKKQLKCFICDGPHMMKDCPKKEKLNTMTVSEGEEPGRVNPLRMVNALQTKEAVKSSSLLYVQVEINGHEVMAMVDTGATNNFVADRSVESLGLALRASTSRVKAVNSEAQVIKGSTEAELRMEPWTGKVTLLAVPLDDFDLILGMDFLRKAKASVMPHLGGVMIGEESNPCFVKGVFDRDLGKKGEGMLSAIQVEAGLKHGEVTYLAALVEEKPDQLEIPDVVVPTLKEFEDVMPPELPKKLPPRRDVDHKIELEPGARAPSQAPYRMGPMELTELRKQLDELLESGFIQPSKAPYGAPVLFQKKADGSLRMCIDYRALNKVTIKNKYPVPNIVELFDRLSRAKYFTKLDLRSGYWQVRIAAGDEPKTACVTRYGSYEFLVLPFGLTNAPATFCNLMNDVLYEYLDRFVVVYLDDIVIYSDSLEAHLEHLKCIFTKLREHSLYVKREKCEFCREEIHFLGHVISQGMVKMDKRKVEAIIDWPAPTKVAELRSFLGLANYYRKFIQGYSKKVNVLTDLLKKDHVWEWNDECEAAFEELKIAVASEPVLKLPDFGVPFEVHTDASDRAIGGVLVQLGHPVAYESRKLKDAEQRYSTHEKEMTAVVHCLEVWRHYLLGAEFVVCTDNVANTYFKTQKKLTPKQARWQEFLAEFDFVWLHKPGAQNQVADALSRKVQEAVASMTVVDTEFLEEIKKQSMTDAVYGKLVEEVKTGVVRKYWLEDGLLYCKGSRLYVPHGGTLRQRILKESHDAKWAGHPGVARMLALLSRSYYWPKMMDDVEAYVKSCLVCQLDKTERKKEAGLLQPLPIPDRPWQSVSMDFILGLPQVEGKGSIFVVVDRFSKYAVFIPAPKVCTAEIAAGLFFQHVVKHFGLPEDIISDRDSRFTGRFWTALFGFLGSELKFSTANHPQTDGQTERMNQLLEEYLRHYVSASQKNWLELMDVAQFCYNLQQSSATSKSPFEVIFGFQPRTPNEVAIQKSGGACPAAYRYAFGRQEMVDEAKASLEKAVWRMKKYADRKRRPLEFEVGDQVLLKLTPQIWKKIKSRKIHKGLVQKYDGPFEIVKKVGNVAYRLKLPDRLKIHPTFHVSFLKPFQPDLLLDGRKQKKRAPPVVKVQFEKKIKKILDHNTQGMSKKNRRTDYLIQWEGEEEADATWEKGVTLWQFEDQIREYWDRPSMRTSSSFSGGGLLDP